MPPCNPGRSDFPSPVLTSARTTFFSSGLPGSLRSSSGDSHPLRTRAGLLAPSSRPLRRSLPSSKSGCAQGVETAECPEPLCPTGSSEHPRGVLRRALLLRRRSYGLMRQTAFLRAPRLSIRPPGLRRLSSLPAGRRSFPTLSLFPLRWRFGPIPRRLPPVHSPISSRRASASRHGKRARQTGMSLQCDFGREPYFGAAVIRFASGSYAR